MYDRFNSDNDDSFHISFLVLAVKACNVLFPIGSFYMNISFLFGRVVVCCYRAVPRNPRPFLVRRRLRRAHDSCSPQTGPNSSR